MSVELAENAVGLVKTSEVLVNVGCELRNLASAVDEMEALIGNLVVAGAFSGSPSIYKLQTLDRLRQSLEGIADFLDGVTELLPESRINAELASRVVKLADLSKRLSHTPAGHTDVDDGIFGSFEAFEGAA